MILWKKNIGLKNWCQKAYVLVKVVGNAVWVAFKQNWDGYEIDLAFFSESDAAKVFTTSTFSFNLLAMKYVSQKLNEVFYKSWLI
jgi:hypothetical protein